MELPSLFVIMFSVNPLLYTYWEEVERTEGGEVNVLFSKLRGTIKLSCWILVKRGFRHQSIPGVIEGVCPASSYKSRDWSLDATSFFLPLSSPSLFFHTRSLPVFFLSRFSFILYISLLSLSFLVLLFSSQFYFCNNVSRSRLLTTITWPEILNKIALTRVRVVRHAG